MESRNKLHRMLKFFVEWPVYMTAVLLVMDINVLIAAPKAGGIVFAYTGIYAVIVVVVFMVRRRSLSQELVRFGVNFGTVQRKLQTELSLPYAVIDVNGTVLWFNEAFSGLFGNTVKGRVSLSTLIPELTSDVFPGDDSASEVIFEYDSRSFRAELKRMDIESFTEDSYWNTDKRLPADRSSKALISLYLYDETVITKLKKDIVDQEAIIGLVYIDNYDEALESIDEVRRSLLTALVDRKINKYFQNYDTVIRKVEKDKYVMVLQNQYLEQLKAAKFPILEEVRSVNIGNEMSVTISIGIGVNADSLSRGYDAARAAIDLALGRGGDQVVIKGTDSVEYYGGKTGSVEKNTKVKSRVKAHALRELIEVKDKVLIMGHRMGDADSFGAAVGVYRIAASLNKEAHIVIGDVTSSIKLMSEKFTENSDYAGMIISPEQALDMQDALTLTVVVDVSKGSFTECPQLLEKAKAVVVLDHHRQSGEAIENAALSYVETAASSACEVVAEILQYIGDDIKLKPVEADAMYAGIMTDSNNFIIKTGVRTFEAAAFLRRNGADVIRLRKLFRTDMREYMIKARAIASTEIFLDSFAFAVCEAEPGVESPTILGAQVANDLMDVNNVKASFVFTDFNGQIYVSARSIDEVNVQVVMEKLGGGGHMSVAGVQFPECSVEDAIVKVKDVLTKMHEGGEL